MRFGITPLFIDEQDIRGAVDNLADIMASRAWDTMQFKSKAKIT